jgi:hypothetical protein
VNAIVAGIRADIAASDYVRRNPSQLDAQVKLFYDGAVEIRRQQNEVIPLGVYLNIEQRLLENNGIGTLYGLPITAAIVNAAAQRRGDVNITWEDLRPLLVSVSEFIKTNSFNLKAAANSVLHGMRTSDGWVKNYSEAYSKSNAQPTPKNDAGTATPSPTATVESSPTSEPSIVNSTPSPTPLAQSTPTPETVVMRSEPVATPTAEPYAFIAKIQTAFDNHDWRTITAMTADAKVNYFGHRHASNAYISRDMQNDAVTYSSAKSTYYPETFTHDVSDPSMIYDSINVYSDVQERTGRLHKALVRLTVGYRIENGVPAIYAIVQKVLSQAKPST